MEQRTIKFGILVFIVIHIIVLGAMGQGSFYGTILSDDGVAIKETLIMNISKGNSATSDIHGLFSLAAAPGDTITLFKAGFKKEQLVFNEEMGNKSYLFHLLQELAFVHEMDLSLSINKQSRLLMLDNYGSYYPDITANIQGTVAGVQLTKVSGVPGAYIDTRIRGISSINSGTEPLILIDGVPFENYGLPLSGYNMSGLGELNPDDFATIEVFKDAVSTSAWGARGANGIIALTTRSGEQGKDVFSISYENSIAYRPTNRLKLIDAAQYYSLAKEANENVGGSGYPAVSLDGYDDFFAYDTLTGIPASPYNTNWLDKALLNGKFHKLSARVSGGDQRTRYLWSGQYRNEENMLLNSSFNNASTRVKIDHRPNKMLSFGINFFGAYNNGDVNDKAWFEMAQTKALPIYPISSPNNEKLYWYTYNNEVNFLQLNEYSWNKTNSFKTVSNAYLSFKPFEKINLIYTSDFGLHYQYDQLEEYRHPFVFPSGVGMTTGNGRVIQQRYSFSNWYNDNNITYAKTINNKHKIKAIIGASLQEYNAGGQYAHLEDMGKSYLHSNGKSNDPEYVAVFKDGYRFASLYSRGNYSYLDKYTALFSIRTDASSKYGPDNRIGHFPGIGGGWIFTREDFIPKIKALDYGQLRFSAGYSGNSNIGNRSYASAATNDYYTSPSSYDDGWRYYGYYGDMSILARGYVPSVIGNSSLHWERSIQKDLGLDFALLTNRISGAIDVFNKKHDNLIVWLPMSPLYGYDNLNYLENAASIVNNGIEITINTINFSKTEDRKFQWFTSLSFTNVKTTVLALPENVDVISSDYNRIEAGHIYGEYYLAEYAGVDPTSGHELIFNPSTGGTIDAEVLTDEEYLGYRKVIEGKSPFPKFYGGLNNTFTYKGVELSFLFYFQGGNHILDMGKQSLQYIGPASTAEATITEEGIPLIWDSKMASRQSTRFLYDASYIRLQNMRLAYNIPDIVIKKVKISSAKVYLSAHNLLTFSKYKGWDPEVIGSNMGTNNPMRAGEIYFEMPHARIILLGIQLNI